METITIYNKESGEILRTVRCHISMVDLQVKEGEDFVNGVIEDGCFIDSEGSPVRKGVQPSKNHVFSFVSKKWEDTRTLSEAVEQQWSLIKEARTKALEEPLDTPFGKFDCDPASQQSIKDSIMMLQALDLAGSPTKIEFTLYDNTVVELSTADMVQVGLLMGYRAQAAHANSRLKRTLLSSATTIDQVESISWE